MATTRKMVIIVLRVSILLSLIFGIYILALAWITGTSLLPASFAAVQRIAEIAVGDSSEMIWLGLVCVASGVLAMADRRRRMKVRQATS